MRFVCSGSRYFAGMNRWREMMVTPLPSVLAWIADRDHQ